MNTLPDIEFSEELIRRFDKLGPRYTSYPTADRWLEALLKVPGVRRFKMGKTTWYEWEPTKTMLVEAARRGRE